jgi:hypothetical protein
MRQADRAIESRGLEFRPKAVAQALRVSHALRLDPNHPEAVVFDSAPDKNTPGCVRFASSLLEAWNLPPERRAGVVLTS